VVKPLAAFLDGTSIRLVVLLPASLPWTSEKRFSGIAQDY
jgi:hypothetical protein